MKQGLRYRKEQVDLIHKVHLYLTEHLEERITIEELSHQFHINTTTLKEAFKAVYGESLAAHITNHRMEFAAKLLTETSDSIYEIARKVGYESQSKFTSTFKTHYHMTPSEYRKRQNYTGEIDK